MWTSGCGPSGFTSPELPLQTLAKQERSALEIQKFKVIKPISKRVSAPEAILAYENQTSEDELQKFNSFYIGKNKAEIRDKGTGRPTKKERRDLEEYKLDFFDWDDI